MPLVFVLLLLNSGQNPEWPTRPNAIRLSQRIAPPSGFRREEVVRGSFSDWLRNLPIRSGRPKVHLYSGALKQNQNAHFAVIDIDVSKKNLQQCADAVIRLRAEYLWSTMRRKDICFRFTSGDSAWWHQWAAGSRPKIEGRKVSWSKAAKADSSYLNFRKYLERVFMYAGTYSLKKALLKLDSPHELKAGDVFIKGGFPGHAVIVVDVVENKRKERRFLLAQSFMPAQDMHILKQPGSESPWYRARDVGLLETPEWTFRYEDARRFSQIGCRR